MSILLGCVADDFTGATDLANTLVKAGMRTVQLLGVPRKALKVPEADCIIVALKSRSNAAAEAVTMSLSALDWLRKQGARQFYFKYCSTFDSTDKGNIGLYDASHGAAATNTTPQTATATKCPRSRERATCPSSRALLSLRGVAGRVRSCAFWSAISVRGRGGTASSH